MVVSVSVSASVGAGGSRLACREVPLLDGVVHHLDNLGSLGRSVVGSDRSDRHGSVVHRCGRNDRHCASTGRR